MADDIEARIRERAHKMWLEDGCPEGKADSHWSLAKMAIAVEDSVAGATSAVAAGIPTIGNLQFVQPAERDERRRLLTDVGVHTLVTSWAEVVDLLP